MAATQSCPCDSGLPYGECCGRYLEDAAWPPTAQALMRSRYTAWCLGREQYLLSTWHPSTRPARLDLATGVAGRWIGLKVCRTEAGTEADKQGSVEFVARRKLNGKAQRLHEVSRFAREGGRWYYIDGVTPPEKARIKPARP